MLILALDTATRAGRFALGDASGLLVERPRNVGGSFSDELLPVVQEMLEATGRSTREIGAIAVTRGPGSFTGVRVGVATAKGLAWALGSELVAVGTLEAMAAALLAEHPDADLAVPVLDARRGELFCGVFRRRDDWVEAAVAPGAATPDAWWQRAAAGLPDLEAAVFGGDGTGLLLGQGDGLRPELREKGTPTLRRWNTAHPGTAGTLVSTLAATPDALPRVHPFALVPDYLRASDAEVKRGLDLTPETPATGVLDHRSRRPDP